MADEIKQIWCKECEGMETLIVNDKVISEVEGDGDLIAEYSVDESQAVSNAGDGKLYSYKGKKYKVITWNSEAMENEAGDKQISELCNDDEVYEDSVMNDSEFNSVEEITD